MKNEANHGNDSAEGLDAQADAPLWDLLGQADSPRVGPYFSRRVLREISSVENLAPDRWWQLAGMWRALRRLPQVAFVAGTPVAALLLVFLGLRLAPVTHAPRPEPAEAVAPAASGDSASQAAAGSEASVAVPSPLPGGTVAANSALPEDVSDQDVEVIAELDTLLKREQSHLWTEDTARF